MSLVGFKARNHRQQTNARGANNAVDDRGTDPKVFAEFNDRLGPFTLDVAADHHNAKCARYFTRAEDGLSQSWSGRVWCNPPFSNIEPWVAKAWEEANAGHVELIAMLLPANRTEQRWWQQLVEPLRDDFHSGLQATLEVEFLPGRMRFVNAGKSAIGPNERPPFGCCLLIWKGAAA